MNRVIRAVVYVLVAAFAAHVMQLYMPPGYGWIPFWVGVVMGCIAVMASILVSDHAEGGLPK